MSDATYDYIVVGAGSAGCVLADRLSANGRHSVLLLEAGPKDNYLWIHIPIVYAKTMFHPVYNWGFSTEPDPNMKGRKLYWPRGRGLGGSSSINGLIYVRGQPEDYDHWASLGNAGWGWKDVLPYFIKCEHNTRGASKCHGGDGPLWCSDIEDRDELIEAIIRAGEQLGVPRTDDFNCGKQDGIGYYQLFTRNGWRCSTSASYLKQARARANLRIETNAHATQVTFDGSRATGVTYLQHESKCHTRAAREVILSAGAIQSPQLLQLSGVGPANFLRDLGIPVVRDVPGVGENLQDHLQLRAMYKVTKPITTNDELNSLIGRFKIGLKWMLFRKGPLAVGINQGGMFSKVLPESRTPDIQFHFSTLSSDQAGGATHPWSGCTFSVCQLRPASRGHVRIKSRAPKAAPAMVANYLDAEVDRRCAIEGLKFARRLAATPALKPYIAAEYRPGPGCIDEAGLLDFAREHGQTIFHPSGTCKMGTDSKAVVDPTLKVHGIAGLRVVDCSIMPTLVSGNTNAPVVMIAEKAADLILGESVAMTSAMSARESVLVKQH